MIKSFGGADFGAGERQAAALQPIANRCTAGSCPTIYTPGGSATSGSVVVQGFIVKAQDAGIDLPDGEALVEIPVELLAEAMRNLS
ncbi:hypothetical protein ACQP2X_00405 [Actinoplanes sp. CA-131856]